MISIYPVVADDQVLVGIKVPDLYRLASRKVQEIEEQRRAAVESRMFIARRERKRVYLGKIPLWTTRRYLTDEEIISRDVLLHSMRAYGSVSYGIALQLLEEVRSMPYGTTDATISLFEYECIR